MISLVAALISIGILVWARHRRKTVAYGALGYDGFSEPIRLFVALIGISLVWAVSLGAGVFMPT